MNENESIQSIRIYDVIAEKYGAIFDVDESDNKYLDEFLSKLPEKARILDLGCGTGRITNYYHQKGFEVIGVDLSEEMLRIARNNYPDGDMGRYC